MNSFFSLKDFNAQLKDGAPLASCQSPDRRLEQPMALVLDMAKLLCGSVAEVGFLVSKGSRTALVMGVTGSRRRPTLTLELTEHHQRRAYVLFSDPLLGLTDADGLPACATSDRTTTREQLHIHQLDAGINDLIEMRRLLANKLIKK